MEKHLIVSVCGFNPKDRSKLEEILQELDRRDIGKRSIFVVPHYENRYLIDNYKKVVDRLHEEKEEGNELCLHGYTHLKKGTANEFESINEEDARNKLQTGKNILKKMDIYPLGFVPPSYKLSWEGEKAVKNEDFAFLVGNPEIKDLITEKTYSSIPIQFSPYYQRWGYAFRLINWGLKHVWLKNNDLVRVDIHPQDLSKSGLFDYALKIIDELRKDRKLSSFHEYLKFKSEETFGERQGLI